MRRVTVISGVPVDDVTLPEAVDRIAEMVETGRRTRRTHQVTTVNVDFIINSLDDPELRFLLQSADLSIPDGMPVVWGSRVLGSPLRERVTGADLVPALVERAQRDGYRILLFGSAPGTAETAAAVLRDRWPGADVLGYGGPFFEDVEDMDDEALDIIREARPDVVCVALGHPKQERWIKYYGPKIDAPVMIGVGGTLDFIAGTKARAPEWMQRNGLEWLHRLLSEPRRLGRRYGRDLVYLGPLLLTDAWRMRRMRPSSRAPAEIQRHSGAAYIVAHGPLDVRLQSIADETASALEHGRCVTVDVRGLERLDQRTLGAMFALAHAVRDQGCEFRIVAGDHVRRGALRRLRVDSFFRLASPITEEPLAPLPSESPSGIRRIA